MKRLSFTLSAILMLVFSGANAQITQPQVLNATQVAKLDLNGKWTGTRSQYSWDKKSFVEVFQYEFDLQQNGNTVTGTSTIINANGDYADMKLEGFIVGNKLQFREYEVASAIRPQGRVWCFKSGELYFAKDGDNLKLTGATPSYMEVYNYPCSGGLTDLQKQDNSANQSLLNVVTPATQTKPSDNLNINTYPNPFTESATIAYTLTDDSKVTVEVFDISGQLVSKVFDGPQKAGSYTYPFVAKTFSTLSGIYVVKMTINGDVYSRQMVQMR